jgi:hypothetical protein
VSPRASQSPSPARPGSEEAPAVPTSARVAALEAAAGVLLSEQWRRFIAALLEHLDDTTKHRSQD